MGMFAGRELNKKSSVIRRPSFTGKHRVKITKCSERVKGFKGDSSIVEYVIVKSNNPEAKPESSGSWVQNYSKNPEYRELKEGNTADFIRAGLTTMGLLAGEEFDGEFEDDDVNRIFGEDNFFEGLEVDLEVISTPITSKPGEFFPLHVWSVPEELEEKAA